MTTETIDVKEYTKDVCFYSNKARKEGIKYVILVNGKPDFEIVPVLDAFKNIPEDDEPETPEEHQARLEAVENLKNGDTVTVDFDKIKTPEDFIKSLEENYEIQNKV